MEGDSKAWAWGKEAPQWLFLTAACLCSTYVCPWAGKHGRVGTHMGTLMPGTVNPEDPSLGETTTGSVSACGLNPTEHGTAWKRGVRLGILEMQEATGGQSHGLLVIQSRPSKTTLELQAGLAGTAHASPLKVPLPKPCLMLADDHGRDEPSLPQAIAPHSGSGSSA